MALVEVDQPTVPSVAVAVKTAPTVVGAPLVNFKLASVALVAVKVPVFTEVDEIFPEDVNDVAVINPAAKLPLPSLLTIVFAVFVEVAEFTADDTVVIVDDKTPPTLFTVVSPVLIIPTSPVINTSMAVPE